MINALTLTEAISNWQDFIQREKKLTKLSPISKEISRLKKELDQSFPELGDLSETIAIYDFYRKLEALQQTINNTEE